MANTTLLIIEGKTQTGQKFRPSNWAQRMSGVLSTFKDHRIHYSPLLRPSSRGGYPCLLVHPDLEQEYPELYQHIMAFAQQNQLIISEQAL